MKESKAKHNQRKVSRTVSPGRRPSIEFDLKMARRLPEIQCTDEEIARACGVSMKTIANRRNNDPEFHALIEQGKAWGRIKIRHEQFKQMEAGSTQMAIWLGKNHLGQTDKADVRNLLKITPADLTLEQLDVIIEHLAIKELGTNDPAQIAAAIEEAETELNRANAIEIEGKVVPENSKFSPN